MWRLGMMEFRRDRLRLRSLRDRTARVRPGDLAGDWNAGTPLADFVNQFPDVLAVRSMRVLAEALVEARNRGAERLLMYGGHVIKCGLGPLLCRWLRDGVFTALATNGAGSIHDLELALYGQTSEDVQEGIRDGSFGMWRETGEHYASALDRDSGLGRAMGEEILAGGGDPRFSPLAMAARMGLPATVHPSLGCDIVHPHPGVSWEKLARASEKDFRTFGSVVGSLAGGVAVNAGSAVVMPEVFLKALTGARNLGFPVEGMTLADFDMIRQYRPAQNVLARPAAALGGTALSITGHHELMLPLLDAFILARRSGDV